jgi:hypothetical protein
MGKSSAFIRPIIWVFGFIIASLVLLVIATSFFWLVAEAYPNIDQFIIGSGESDYALPTLHALAYSHLRIEIWPLPPWIEFRWLQLSKLQWWGIATDIIESMLFVAIFIVGYKFLNDPIIVKGLKFGLLMFIYKAAMIIKTFDVRAMPVILVPPENALIQPATDTLYQIKPFICGTGLINKLAMEAFDAGNIKISYVELYAQIAAWFFVFILSGVIVGYMIKLFYFPKNTQGA